MLFLLSNIYFIDIKSANIIIANIVDLPCLVMRQLLSDQPTSEQRALALAILRSFYTGRMRGIPAGNYLIPED
jgi:hypothetical protein